MLCRKHKQQHDLQYAQYVGFLVWLIYCVLFFFLYLVTTHRHLSLTLRNEKMANTPNALGAIPSIN